MKKPIAFNSVKPLGKELENMKKILSDYALLREKYFSEQCLALLKTYFPKSALYLTHSGTGALEMMAIGMDIKEGDEIIMPSYTFVSTANAFVSYGAKPVFVDISPQDLNIDLDLIENAITEKTKAIVAVHYAGHSTDLKKLKQICEQYELILIEDAAMAFGGKWENNYLGSIGDMGMISFDVTKQISAIQGGLLLVNKEKFAARMEDIYHIGTNREKFIDKKVPYYEWVDKGSKFQMNELNAAVLYENLQNTTAILKHRNTLSKIYYAQLIGLEQEGCLQLLPQRQLEQNYHEFYVLTKTKKERIALSKYLSEKGIEALFHYIPLHLSEFGEKNGIFHGDNHTEHISHTLLRLPMHLELKEEDIVYVSEQIKAFYYGK